MSLYSPETYSRSNIMAMLAAMPFEEKRWTLHYLINIMVVNEKQTTIVNDPISLFCGGWSDDSTPVDELLDEMRCHRSNEIGNIILDEA